VDPDGIELGSQGRVVGEAHPPVAVAAQGLGREEGGAGDIGQGAGFFAFVFRAEGLCRIFDDEEAVIAGDGVYGVVIGAQAEEIDGDDTFGRESRVRCSRLCVG